MRPTVIQRIFGLLLGVFSVTMLPPLAVAWYYGDAGLGPFFESFLLVLAAGFLLWLPVRKDRGSLKLREGFLVVVLFWLILGLAGAVPLLLNEEIGLDLADAVFESMSGLTTTGATVVVGLDDLPRSVLFYRQQLQWLGGMGIIVLAVAILPMLGIGGMQLYRAETPGPVKDHKLTPRIAQTAKALWYIYLGLTVLCALTYWWVGMEPFDAISHSFSTVAIGGFSTHDASLAYFDSAAIESVATLFMLLAGINFALHFYAVRTRSWRPYWADAEFKAYLAILLSASAFVSVYLYYTGAMETWTSAVRYGVFQTVSVATTTGFTTTDFSLWPAVLPVFLIFLSFIGGSAGSTGGGMKVIRVLLLFKQGQRELRRLIHPNAHLLVKVGKNAMSDQVVDAVWGFFAAYVLVFLIFMLLMMAVGLDQVSAFSAVAASMNNLGPGLGDVSANYASLSDMGKLLLSLAMLMGRLEIFTLLVLFTPEFWKR
ncbi:MAG: TrkH family potassium uptake protein [bacterium]